MVSEPLRYVTERRNRNGTVRHYWQRPGYPLVRLPSDPVERLAKVTELNASADGKGQKVAENTVAWCIREFKQSDEWEGLSAATQRAYKPWLAVFEQKWGRLTPKGAITRKVAKALRKELKHRPSTCHHAIAALSWICEVAREHDLMPSNPCHRLKLPSSKKRSQIFTDADCDAFLKACKRPEIRDAFMVLRFTAQRPIDALKLPRTAYNKDQIELRQQKTKALVWVHCHRDLRAYIEQHMPARGTTLITRPDGKPLSQRSFNEGFRETLQAAGLDHLQARDLRRTAVCELDDAGCTPSQIASVTGHSEASIVKMLAVYRPKLAGVSKIAVQKWEQNEQKILTR